MESYRPASILIFVLKIALYNLAFYVVAFVGYLNGPKQASSAFFTTMAQVLPVLLLVLVAEGIFTPHFARVRELVNRYLAYARASPTARKWWMKPLMYVGILSPRFNGLIFLSASEAYCIQHIDDKGLTDGRYVMASVYFGLLAICLIAVAGRNWIDLRLDDNRGEFFDQGEWR